jgi:aryl-alcohol dehydrogenase-like predicted oxidoreductase
MANGRLTRRNHESDFHDSASTLKDLADKHGVGVDAIAMSFVLHQQWASVVLSGASTTEQLDQNLKALQVRLDQEDVSLLEGLAEPPGIYWKKRSGLAWN